MEILTVFQRRTVPWVMAGTVVLSVMLGALVLILAPVLHSLFAKTFAILTSQLMITWIVTYGVIQTIREMHAQGVPGISAVDSPDGGLDLEVDWSFLVPYFWVGMLVDIGLFLWLITFGTRNLLIGVPIFTLWSMLTGVELAVALLSVDEGLGARVVGIAAMLTAAAALVGIYSQLDFSWLGTYLFIVLLLLLLGVSLRLFISISRWKSRVLSFFGVLVFELYLLVDFGRLADLAEQQTNSWPVAMHMAVGIYLDVINLLMFLLDLLSD